MRVLVCGSRSFVEVKPIATRLQQLPPDAVIFHGGARGADTVVGMIAAELGFTVEPPYRADWQTHGKRAGFVRNLEMLDTDPDLVLAFWDGESRGTRHTIKEAKRRGIPVDVVAG